MHSSQLSFTPTLRDKLLEINERQRWVNPSNHEAWNRLNQEQKTLQDDQIFNTGRLINCGHFASAVFGDYLSSWVSSCLLAIFANSHSHPGSSVLSPTLTLGRSIRLKKLGRRIFRSSN